MKIYNDIKNWFILKSNTVKIMNVGKLVSDKSFLYSQINKKINWKKQLNLKLWKVSLKLKKKLI